MKCNTESFRQYVPYASLKSHDLPKLLDITNNDKRVYLREQSRDRTVHETNTEHSLYNGFDSKRFLDLGVAPLQRIINELRSLSAENAEEHRYDHRAAKESGLINYCEFLQGEEQLSLRKHK